MGKFFLDKMFLTLLFPISTLIFKMALRRAKVKGSLAHY